MGIIKTLIEKRQEKLHKKCQRMNSEIICAIAYQVQKEQTKQAVTLPPFQEVQNRYNSLGIKTHKDVINVYKLFHSKRLVSGIEL